ncbi:mitochondrial 54S ribosomal protein uL4m NDAI_0C00870 [Naumovozyma dairenensis CBS 421]|uniref:Large ribosomal subunit protein uL4m n=1 Tax=Naumovozyma dairenensis (strain ATCC 10597 / BCRC 20456 / CBS 421 / NBRC 0211 / NRRL Y-12639) TaxID=1071378 RepID=G0W7I7_NAUDC|nr:hypothetical protein NDAI_0C00870 [Naumovozyma dairenensis CBS 421]CCD23748.1 hypothetical protein NDAI_0C00870 [Naumovozyma dairenensis CBS 421]
MVKLRRYQSTLSSLRLPNIATPPKYTLATLRAFPSLEPLSFIPVPTSIFAVPLRRDILWKAVVYENDNRRVGASNPPGRGDVGYSRHKLLRQKGIGKARVGDANSPIRHNGGRALARNAPNDYSTELPKKMYSLAMVTALSHLYRKGALFVIGENDDVISSINKNDIGILDIIKTRSQEREEGEKEEQDYRSVMFKKFIRENELTKKRLLFVTSKPRIGLLNFTGHFKKDVDIVQQEGLEVNDLLKSQKVFLELDVLKYLIKEHGRFPEEN